MDKILSTEVPSYRSSPPLPKGQKKSCGAAMNSLDSAENSGTTVSRRRRSIEAAGNRIDGLPERCSKFRHEELHQCQEVLKALAQPRHEEWDDVRPVEEVRPKSRLPTRWKPRTRRALSIAI